MAITINLGSLQTIIGTLRGLTDQKMTAKTAWKISKVAKVVDDEFISLEESKQKLYEKYGADNGEGQVVIETDNIELFKQEFVELMGTEIEISVPTFELDELDGVEITPKDMIILTPFINAE